jgi:hypothetical protein
MYFRSVMTKKLQRFAGGATQARSFGKTTRAMQSWLLHHNAMRRRPKDSNHFIPFGWSWTD